MGSIRALPKGRFAFVQISAQFRAIGVDLKLKERVYRGKRLHLDAGKNGQNADSGSNLTTPPVPLAPTFNVIFYFCNVN